MRSSLKSVVRWRELILHLSRRAIGQRYRRTMLGVVWTVINPLAMALIITVVYGQLLGATTPDYTSFLCAGIFVWGFISESASTGCTVLHESQGFIRQTNVPLITWPVVTLISKFTTFLVGFVTVSIALILLSSPPWMGLLAMLPGLVLLLVFCWGITMFQAVVGTILRDHQHMTSIVLRALFFATPIIYHPQLIDSFGQSYIYRYNPFHYVVESVRQPLLTGTLPPLKTLAITAAAAIVVAVVGHLLFCRVDRRIVRYL